MRLLLLAALAAFFASAHAEPEPPAIGLVIPVPIPICMEQDTVSQIWQAHLTGGEDTGKYVFDQYREQGTCGFATPPVIVSGVVDTQWLEFKGRLMWAAFVKVIGRSGKEYWGIAVNSKVKPPKST